MSMRLTVNRSFKLPSQISFLVWRAGAISKWRNTKYWKTWNNTYTTKQKRIEIPKTKHPKLNLFSFTWPPL